MKLKILLSLVLLTSSFCCFAMEPYYAEASKSRETFPFGKLPRDIKREILSWSWENINKQDAKQMAEALIRSIKQYNAMPKTVNKEFYEYITESFNKLLDKLTDEDFKNLNQYISDSLKSDKTLPKDFNLLVRSLKKLNKLNKIVEYIIDNSVVRYAETNQLHNLIEVIKANANINAKDVTGNTALIWAIFYNYTDVAKFLIFAGADVNAKSFIGRTALTESIKQHNIEISKLLINAHANVNENNNLIFASKIGNKDAVKLLINARG